MQLERFVRELALVILMVWITIDSVIVGRRRARAATSADRFSMLLIMVGNFVAWTVGTALAYAGVGALPESLDDLRIAGIGVLLLGIAVRSTAMYQLGRYHMPNVAIYADHQVYDKGLYAFVRHPSYMGALIAFVGFGIALGSWVSLVVILGTAIVAYTYRIRVEEMALVGALGERYIEYARRTWRIVPWVY